MSTITEAGMNQAVMTTRAGLGLRTAVLVYSLLSYGIGMAGLCWLILAAGGLLPYGFGPITTESTLAAIMVNTGLITLFGIQHSVMARGSFKRILAVILPQPVERSTFVLVSGLVLSLAIWCWQPLPGVVWSTENVFLKGVLWALYAAGWSYLVLSTFVTNHFELFGLRQAYLYFRGAPYTPVNFVRKWMYTYSRHPMMLGILLGLWSIPEMSVSHFILSAMLSTYIFVGVYFEEKDLVRNFGDTYMEYRKVVGTFFTIN